MPTCKINGHEITVKEGATIIEAFYQLEEEICHYCYHPGLSVAGVCRLCMVHIEGNPKLQIACNTVVRDGMVITNQTAEVKETVRWGLDFHLINHPLDCPICDQAGECELQIQYMKFGSYVPEMAEKKVKKKKAVDLGSKIVLDTERCILCSRCVRFTDEVTKTHELGIFQRGDQSEIGTVDGNPLENNYALNTVDICPVGALTSKNFRFKQRVWYLKNKKTICTGCSTGCSVKAYYNEEGVFRLRPEFNKDVNGHWMCDEGRNTYEVANKKQRLKKPRKGVKGKFEKLSLEQSMSLIKTNLEIQKEKDSNDIALVVTGSYTHEEYETLFRSFSETWKVKNVFHWSGKNTSQSDFDGILLRNDRVPNTKGLEEEAQKQGISLLPLDEMKSFSTVVVWGPENIDLFPDFKEKVKAISEKTQNLIWFSACDSPEFENINCDVTLVPLKVHFEKSGSFTNALGIKQSFEKITTPPYMSFCVKEVCRSLENHEMKMNYVTPLDRKTNHFTNERGSL